MTARPEYAAARERGNTARTHAQTRLFPEHLPKIQRLRAEGRTLARSFALPHHALESREVLAGFDVHLPESWAAARIAVEGSREFVTDVEQSDGE